MHPVAKETRQAALDWPVFRFASFFHAYEGKKIPAEKAVLMQILSGASSVLGSCASCLFRASVFKAGDFSANHFHYGDTAWAYQHLPSISLTYYPTKVAQFWVEKRKTKRIVDKQQIYLMMKSMSEYLHAYQRNMVRLLIDSLQNLDFLRGEKPKAGWWWHPSAWVYRWHRQRSSKYLLQCLQRN